MSGKQFQFSPWILISVSVCSTIYAQETYVEGEAGYCVPNYEEHGPCPCSACTHWPLYGTTTPLPLPDEYPPSCGAGFLFGLQAGYANTNWSLNQDNVSVNFPNTTIDDVSTDGFAARVYLGYDFNDYFGIEAGYTYLPQVDVSGTQTVNGVPTSVSGGIANYTIDLLGKFMWHFTDRYGVYVKGGGSYYRSGTSGFVVFSDDGSQAESLNHIGFTMGLGMFFNIVPYLTADVSWMRFYGNDDNLFASSENPDANSQPSPDAFFFGISYKFEQRYLNSI